MIEILLTVKFYLYMYTLNMLALIAGKLLIKIKDTVVVGINSQTYMYLHVHCTCLSVGLCTCLHYSLTIVQTLTHHNGLKLGIGITCELCCKENRHHKL